MNLIKFIISKSSICLLLLICGISEISFAQLPSKIGIELIHYLKNTDKDELVPLLVQGSPTTMIETVNRHGGNIRLNIDNLYSLEIPSRNVIHFSKESAVELIEFSLDYGRSLNDTMLTNTNVDSIIQIAAPLSQEYTGKGVLLGVIDSGIELAHNDFKDSSGNTRVLYVWDQGVPYNPTHKPGNYSYGVEWDSTDINAGISTHDDKASEFGHGSMVTGAAASNGLASGTYRGIAPEVSIIAVATDFNKPNWLQTIAESVDYIFKKADSLNMPCVINASVGTYRGSHDGKDIAARLIDLLIKQKSGRSFVCAAGNAGNLNFHLRQEPQNDTVFTWFEPNPALFSGFGGVYFEAWSDTNDFNQMQFSIGADRVNGNQYEYRGSTNYTHIAPRLNVVYRDSIISKSGNLLAYIDTYAEESQGRYKLEVAIFNPDSSNYLFRLETAGIGKLDVWSSYALFRSSDVKTTNLPSISQFPDIAKYQKTDSLQTMVSSFTCLPSVITVGNYVNRNTYLDYNGNLQNMGSTPGAISVHSSLGPNRNGYLKPDISSAGDYMMTAGRIATMVQLQAIEPQKISIDGMHMRNGGTSMASPTVAGMVALYLEMCKTATYSDIKTKLINSAKSDSYTSNLPNPKWGSGKADGFQFLSSSAFLPGLNYGSTSFCNIDSIALSTLSTYNKIRWNTGDSSLILQAKSSGNYFAHVTNSLGCEAKTNEITLNFYNSPNKPALQRINDTLQINTLGNYQWFFNNVALQGETNSSTLATISGNYYCKLTDPTTSCSINSDTLSVIIIGIESNPDNKFKIYPNPSNGNIFVSGIRDNSITIEVFNQTGQLVQSNSPFNYRNEINLDLSYLSKGMYFLRIKVEDSFILEKIRIE
jgi:subtilisin family serine protease